MGKIQQAVKEAEALGPTIGVRVVYGFPGCSPEASSVCAPTEDGVRRMVAFYHGRIAARKVRGMVVRYGESAVDADGRVVV